MAVETEIFDESWVADALLLPHKTVNPTQWDFAVEFADKQIYISLTQEYRIHKDDIETDPIHPDVEEYGADCFGYKLCELLIGVVAERDRDKYSEKWDLYGSKLRDKKPTVEMLLGIVDGRGDTAQDVILYNGG